MKKTSFKAAKVLVTGGSSGIGYELARLFLAEGADVWLVAREGAKLRDAAARLEAESGGRVQWLTADLCDPSVPATLHEAVRHSSGPVDVLVNNAGFGIYGPFAFTPAERALGMIDANVRGLVELTHRVLPSMIERGSGHVLNVASTAAFQGVPNEAVYGATKAFVLAFSEALAEELRPKGVVVSCLCPGPTDTAFFTRGTFAPSEMVRRSMMDASAVAKAGLEALRRGKPLTVAGLHNRTMIFAERFVPRNWVTRLARRMVEYRRESAT